METKRLILRNWLPTDYHQFAELNSDPTVMEFFPKTLSQSESNAFAEKSKTLISKNGWGLWAVEIKTRGSFIGYVGLHRPHLKYPFSPFVEIGWRLSKEFWGYGYATEAAREALKFAFESLELYEVVSFTSLQNKRSQSVMERLDMINTQENFKHPSLPDNHPLCEHVLYKITKAMWNKTNHLHEGL